MFISKDIRYVGVNDYGAGLFESLYVIPHGMAYNSYVIVDEKIAIMDTVEEEMTEQWLGNIRDAIGERKPDFLIIQHMEPDHSANIGNLVREYPGVTLVASGKAFQMMKNYFGDEFACEKIVIADGDALSLGKHRLKFLSAPMVHWPEVMMTYDSCDKVLFTADAFGKFGTWDAEDDWVEEARRYYFGIVGKYGVQVQSLLHKLTNIPVETICPLHGPVLNENLNRYLELYNIWSKYEAEEEGVLIAYTSVYGNTKRAVRILAEALKRRGMGTVITRDLARCDMSEAVALAFKYSKLVLATTTYNAHVFPPMRDFINRLTERNYANRVVALVENGSWASVAAAIMRKELEVCKNLQFTENTVRIESVVKEENVAQIEQLAEELCGGTTGGGMV